MMSCDITWHHQCNRGLGCVIQGGSVMESYQFEILDQYFSVIVTIPHISIKSQSLCIPTYFSVYLKPQEVIIMHKIHKWKPSYLADDGVHRHDVTWSWLVPSLIFEFDRLITYKVSEMGLDICHQPGPVMAPATAPQPHSLTATLTLSTFNLISINYANVWLHTLNVVEGFNMNCIKIYSIILSVTCHSLRNFPPLIHIPSYPFMNFQNPASYYFLS